MIIAVDIQRYYEEISGVVNEAAAVVGDVLRAYCSEHGYLFEERVKTLASVAEKIESGRFADWSSIDDLYACSVIVSLPSQEQLVLEFLEATFQQVGLRKRGTVPKPPEVFRFDSTRFIGQLRQVGPDITRGGLSLSQMRFEIQVKTIFDYAWGKATHSLVYKSQGNEWKALRLASQLKAIAETLDMLVLGFEQTAAYVADGKWPVVEDKSAILTFFQKKFADGQVPSELRPESWTRFADNVHRLFTAFDGQDPACMPNRRLRNLSAYLDAVDKAMNELGPDRMPRSISLFQFVVGVLGSSLTVTSAYSYYLPIAETMNWIFGNLAIPGQIFGQSPILASEAEDVHEGG